MNCLGDSFFFIALFRLIGLDFVDCVFEFVAYVPILGSDEVLLILLVLALNERFIF